MEPGGHCLLFVSLLIHMSLLTSEPNINVVGKYRPTMSSHSVASIPITTFTSRNWLIEDSHLVVIHDKNSRARLNIKMTSYHYTIRIPMLKIRRSRDRLIFNMGIPIPGKDSHYIETGPWC